MTVDFVNPEAPWPALAELARRSEQAGYRLRERLCVYPEFVRERPEYFDARVLERLRAVCAPDGYPRGGFDSRAGGDDA